MLSRALPFQVSDCVEWEGVAPGGPPHVFRTLSRRASSLFVRSDSLFQRVAVFSVTISSLCGETG